ncbi:SAV_915 family protein [Mycolicibacterium setense]
MTVEYPLPPNRDVGSEEDRWRAGQQAADDLRTRMFPQTGWESTRSHEVPARSAATQRAADGYALHRPTQNRRGGPPVDSNQGLAATMPVPGATAAQAETKAIPTDFPPVVYLPCAEAVEDPRAARIDMRQTRDGRTALLAYSALDRLHYCCGDDQAWIVMPTAGLSQLQSAHPFQLLLLDVVIPAEERRGHK